MRFSRGDTVWRSRQVRLRDGTRSNRDQLGVVLAIVDVADRDFGYYSIRWWDGDDFVETSGHWEDMLERYNGPLTEVQASQVAEIALT